MIGSIESLNDRLEAFSDSGHIADALREIWSNPDNVIPHHEKYYLLEAADHIAVMYELCRELFCYATVLSKKKSGV